MVIRGSENSLDRICVWGSIPEDLLTVVDLHTKLYVWMVLLFLKMGSVSWSLSDKRLQEGKPIICNVPKKMGTQEELTETSV